MCSSVAAYSRQPLTVQDLKPADDIRAEIEAWKSTRSSGGVAAMEVDDSPEPSGMPAAAAEENEGCDGDNTDMYD